MVLYTSSGTAVLTIRACSWGTCGQCQACIAREAGRDVVRKYGDALERLGE
jgi:hypothetical protein